MNSFSNIIEEIDKEQLRIDLPKFSTGDTVIVRVKIKEGKRERLQAFEGVVIGIKNRGINSAFTVRKISSGESLKRTFQTHSKNIDNVEVKRYGAVRQAKLGYIENRFGKRARITEKLQKVIN